jgi:hypothetical protein
MAPFRMGDLKQEVLELYKKISNILREPAN